MSRHYKSSRQHALNTNPHIAEPYTPTSHSEPPPDHRHLHHTPRSSRGRLHISIHLLPIHHRRPHGQPSTYEATNPRIS